MPLKIRAILVLAIGTVMGLGLSLGGTWVAARNAPTPTAQALQQARLFAEVMERVKHDYVEPIGDEELLESAIRGMVSDLDIHSQYLDAREYHDIRVSTSGAYTGVGIEVSTRDEEIVVVAPIDNSPAQRAGILAGDVIIAIDGASVADDGLRKTIRRLRGRSGTPVTLTIVRQPADELLIFDLQRDNIQVASVRHELLEPTIGYVRVGQFTDSTAGEVASAIDAMTDSAHANGDTLAGIILDLRNNPGGILDAAVDVSDLFLDEGLIVSAEGRTPEARFARNAHRGDLLDGAPVVVLVNAGTASASEIVAGALQDHHRALIVGTKTFGKGLVQTVMPLSRGRAIKLTTSRYFTPSGASIHETGIEPDVFVESSVAYPGLALDERLDHIADEQLHEALDQIQLAPIMHSLAH
ncbi:MAG: S41 family peptidase [Woeseia sp.]|nr:S41 family peptidase [Woeseia sp.]MBT8096849.1 S41 family peptidase [Woeseia sp.]NNE59615.1 S41 family peptidase [Woeseia sp.]NNL55766.1 S41 family peptidase [Woeseia sp.]